MFCVEYCIKNAEVKKMQNKFLEKVVELINCSLKVDANSTSTTMAFQPAVPQKIERFKKNDK